MIRHLTIAALRNMAANRLLSAISILGLSVGIAAAILMALVVRNQFTFDRFIPGYERTYLVLRGDSTLREAATLANSIGVQACVSNCARVDYQMATLLKLNIPEIENATRLMFTDDINGGPPMLKRGDVAAREALYWADPNAFDVLPLPVLYGSLGTALARPDGIVLPRSVAQKYFGRDGVVGQTISVNGHPMMVTAVIQDLPSNASTLQSGIFASGLAPFSKLVPANGGLPDATARGALLLAETYIRLKTGASGFTVEGRVPYMGAFGAVLKSEAMYDIKLLRLDRLNLSEDHIGGVPNELNPGIWARITVAGLAGLLVLFIASINFVNLMVIRAARREKEVGVRKSCGASRPALILQFLGEAMIAVIVAAGIAMAATEWLLPAINAFLRTGAELDYAHTSSPLFFLLLGILVLGLAAGAYPAFVLSAFKPARALRGWANMVGNADIIRNALVTLQFAILIILAISASVIWQQHNYAQHGALHADIDQMLIVRDRFGLPARGPVNVYAAGACPTAFMDQVSKLPGVRGEACTTLALITGGSGINWYNKNHEIIGVLSNQVEPGIFALYGIKSVAGTLTDTSGTVINVSAVRMLGFASPQAALGHSWLTSEVDAGTQKFVGEAHSIITAVVPDFSFTSVTGAVQPTIFSPWLRGFRDRAIHIKLNGKKIPETLAAIDHLMLTTYQPGSMDRFFLNDYIEQLYQDMMREAQFFSVFSGIAIVLACLGLVGIAVSTAERRTKEFGIRKAMGATSIEVVALLLWQFSQPVLWANVIAWPVAWWLMRRWLSGFAYHVELHWWIFVAASGGALLVALLTMSVQAWITARGKPVMALRYE